MSKRGGKAKKKGAPGLEAARAKLHRDAGAHSVSRALLELAAPHLTALDASSPPGSADALLATWLIAWNLPLLRSEAKTGDEDAVREVLATETILASSDDEARIAAMIEERCRRFGQYTQRIMKATVKGEQVIIEVASMAPRLVGMCVRPDGTTVPIELPV
jgi:hypothetical protein